MAPLLRLRDVGFAYRGGDGEALAGVELELVAGETLGVVGASGAGKTTLVRTANGLVPAFFRGTARGVVEVGGEPVAALGPARAARSVGTIFQDFDAQLFSTNASLEVAFGPSNLGVAREEIGRRVERELRRVGLDGFEGREPATLSGGEKQRLAIASVLAMQPRLLLLDEPTTDLDPVGKARVHELLREVAAEGVAVLVVEHDTDELLDLDGVLHLEEGRVAGAGPPRTFFAAATALEERGVTAPALAHLAEARSLGELPSDLEPLRRELEGRADRGNDAGAVPASGGDPLVEVDDLVHRYPGAAGDAVGGVSFSIRPGEFVALLGANGSGKTTLAKHLMGLLRPTGGDVRVGGTSVGQGSTASLARRVGYVFQDPDHQIFSATVREEIGFVLGNLDVEPADRGRRIDEALAVVGLEGKADADPFTLTRGERQRLAVGSVLVAEPELLILDEPTTGLDHRDRERMLALLAELNGRGHTILVITHAMEVVGSHCRRVLVMAGGRLRMDGSVREVFRAGDVLAEACLRPPPAWRIGAELGLETLTPAELRAAVTGGSP